MADLVVRSQRVVTDGAVKPASIHVADGKVTRVGAWTMRPRDVVDYGELAILPGIVDTHVHLNEPGRTEWEGFATATRAAAIGGVTTLVDMPLNSIPPTTTREAFAAKRAAATGQCAVDVGFWGGVVPGNAARARRPRRRRRARLQVLPRRLRRRRVRLGRRARADARDADPRRARRAAARARRGRRADRRRDARSSRRPIRVATRRTSRRARRPPRSRRSQLVIAAVPRDAARARTSCITRRRARCRCLREARAEGLPLTAETCPHYLHFTAEAIPDGATPFKCAPPIREAANREALWRALAEGVLDFVASRSLAVHARTSRRWSRATSWPRGAASPGCSSRCPSCGPRRRARGHTLVDIARWMSAGPARLAGLTGTKGAIAAGDDADLVVFADDATHDGRRRETVHHRHKVTPYAGETLRGAVHATYLRGDARRRARPRARD